LERQVGLGERSAYNPPMLWLLGANSREFPLSLDCHRTSPITVQGHRLCLADSGASGLNPFTTSASVFSACRAQWLMVPRHRRSTVGRRAFSVAGPREWNSLPDSPREPTRCTDSFRLAVRTHLYYYYFYSSSWLASPSW